MDKKRAARLGKYLKTARENARLSLRQVSEETGIDNGLISRMESGAIAKPDPEKLRRIAEVVGAPLAEVFDLAQYFTPNDYPAESMYLRLKHPDLDEARMDDLTADLRKLLANYDIDSADGPAPGEDET